MIRVHACVRKSACSALASYNLGRSRSVLRRIHIPPSQNALRLSPHSGLEAPCAVQSMACHAVTRGGRTGIKGTSCSQRPYKRCTQPRTTVRTAAELSSNAPDQNGVQGSYTNGRASAGAISSSNQWPKKSSLYLLRTDGKSCSRELVTGESEVMCKFC